MLLERFTGASLATMMRKAPITLRERLRVPACSALYASTLAMVVLFFLTLPRAQTMGPIATSALALASVACALSAILYWSAFLHWPFNTVGHMLLSGEISAATVPGRRDTIRDEVIDEWRSRFGDEATKSCERVWRLERQLTGARIALAVTTACLVNSFRSDAFLFLSVPELAALATMFVLRARYEGDMQRARGKLAIALGLPRVEGFPPLEPQSYRHWLAAMQAAG